MNVNNIVMATDFSEASLIALETALSLALESKATLHLLHVVELPATGDPEAVGEVEALAGRLCDEGKQRLEALIPENKEQDLTIETAVLRGSPASQIARFAKRIEADLLVVGTHGRRGWARVVMGSTAEQLLRHAPCQVLVVKPTVHSEVAVAHSK
ncbi:MAG: universal stress protein [Acidobacteria bacterium]|nr:universal stress protein [Acidobacteriota bacterium]